MTNGIPHPFEIFWDVDSASYFIFVPDGCVLVNGVAATNDSVQNGNLALGFGDTPPEKVYCHVSKNGDGWKFTIDGETEEDGAKYNVLIATFGQSENDGQSYDVVCSAISLSGEAEADEISIESSREIPSEIEGEEPTVVEELAIEGWHDKDNSESKLGDLLTGDTEDESRQILIRNGKGGATEYLPIGKIVIPDQEEVVGSDYIAAETKQVQGVPKREISAKITTPDPDDRTVENPVHAMLTHDTDQFVRAKKTFKNADGTKTIELDAATGIETISHGTSSQQKKIVLNPSQIPNDCQQKTIQVRTLTVNHPRAKTAGGPTSETYHILGCDDATINEGDAIEKIESGTSTQSGEYTITPVTITLKDGTVLPAFNIKAKNGADGDKGDDGASVTEATAGTPVVSGNTTTTPITFTLSDGSTVGPVNVVSTNGVDASGSDYIEVGDGTGGTTKGQVKAKVSPTTTDPHALVTTDTAQKITSAKKFSAIGTATTLYVLADGVEMFQIRKGADSDSSALIYSPNQPMRIFANNKKILLESSSNNVVLKVAPTDLTSTSSLAVATLGWVNDKFMRKGSLASHSFSWEGTKKADIAASADIAVDSKTIQGSGGITVTEHNRVITISGSGSQVSGYTTPAGTYDYEATGQEWDSTNHRIVIHKVKKTYENGLLKTREAIADEYIQFVEETV